jgi:hypothetical protein
MKLVRFFSRMPAGMSRSQTLQPGWHTSRSGAAASVFNAVASIILLAGSSAVMAWLVRSSPDDVLTFAPFYAAILLLVGSFVFTGRHGNRWIETTETIEGLCVLALACLLAILLPVWIVLRAGQPAPVDPADKHPKVDEDAGKPFGVQQYLKSQAPPRRPLPPH